MSHPNVRIYTPANTPTQEQQAEALAFARAFFDAIMPGQHEQPADEATARTGRVITMSAE